MKVQTINNVSFGELIKIPSKPDFEWMPADKKLDMLFELAKLQDSSIARLSQDVYRNSKTLSKNQQNIIDFNKRGFENTLISCSTDDYKDASNILDKDYELTKINVIA